MRKVLGLFALAVACSILLHSCAKPKAKLSYLEPPREYRGGIRKVAVLPFHGKGLDGGLLASEIEAELLRVRVGGESYFRVVSRTDIEKVMSEIKLSSSGVTEEQLKLGRLLRAEGLLLGSADVSYSTDRFYRRESRCVETKGSGLIKKCIRYVERSVPCQTRFVRLILVPKLIDVERGEVVYSRRIIKEKKYTYCDGDWAVPKTFSELVAEVRTQAIRELIRDIAPYRVTVEGEFIDDEKGVAERDTFIKAIELAKEGKVRQACDLFKELRAQTYAVLYNRGLCAELEGNLIKARSLYLKAKALREDARIEKALARVDSRLQKEAQLRELIK